MDSINRESYYTILGIPINATPVEIKKQYRTLSLIHHPDRGGDADVFKLVSEAYATLIDDVARQAYDTERVFSGGGVVREEVVEELFARLFAQQSSMFHTPFFACPPPAPPAPIIYPLALTLQQRYDGGEFEIVIEKQHRNRRICTVEKETCYVSVPRGAQIDETIILYERGHSIDDLVFGNVHIVITPIPHPEFTQRGMDLCISRELTLKDALCGCVIQLHHPSGKNIRIDNTDTNITTISPGQIKKVGGLGFRRGNERGDLIIDFSVKFPTTLTPTQIEALREIL